MRAAAEFDSARLSLRLPGVGDFEESAAMWGDPAVVRYIGDRPFTREESWARLLRNVGHWHISGYGLWTVRERASGTFVGEVGFGSFYRMIEPALDDAPEAGWVLSPGVHGKGFGTEAARAAHDWIERHRAPARTVCIIQAGNDASLRVAAKCGYGEFARTTYRNAGVILFARRLSAPPRDQS